MKKDCPTCGGSGVVHSHNPKCWTCNGIGYSVNDVFWSCPCGTSESVHIAFMKWMVDGTLTSDQN